MTFRYRWYDLIFLGVLVYLFILQIAAIWPFTIDDMYISLRYAKHWVAGDGLLWNSDSSPVEGYSNFSFVVLGAGALLLHLDPVVVLKAAGVIGLLFTCYFTYLITRFWFGPRESLLSCIALLFYKGQIIWSVSGLETTVYQALLSATVYFIFCGFEDKKNSFFYAGFLLALVGFTRPEAPAFMALFFVLIVWHAQSVNNWQGVGLFVLPMLVLFLPYFIWRYYYFGYLFPNSVYCKGFVYSTNIVDLHYLQFIWPCAVLAAVAAAKMSDKRHYFLWLPSVVYCILLIGSDPVVAFANRLFLPAFALLLPLTLLGIRDTLLWFLKGNDGIYWGTFYAAFSLFLWFFIPAMSLHEYRFFSQNPVKGEQLRMAVVRWLAKHTHAGDKVVSGDSGLIPYFSNGHFVDSYCLNNLEMAHYRAGDRYQHFCQNVLEDKPKIIVITSLVEAGTIVYTPSDMCIINLLNKQSQYKMVKAFSTENNESSYRYELFAE